MEGKNHGMNHRRKDCLTYYIMIGKEIMELNLNKVASRLVNCSPVMHCNYRGVDMTVYNICVRSFRDRVEMIFPKPSSVDDSVLDNKLLTDNCSINHPTRESMIALHKIFFLRLLEYCIFIKFIHVTSVTLFN